MNLNGEGTDGDAVAGTCGCGFLDLVEVDRLLDGGMDADREKMFRDHLNSGCMACALLAADLDSYRDVLEHGVLADERKEFDTRKVMLEKRLGREVAGLKGSGPAGRSFFTYRVLPAAAAIMLVAVGLVTMMRSPEFPGARLAMPGGGEWTVEAMPFSEPPALRGEANSADLWQEAGEAYGNQDYAEVENLLAGIGRDDPHGADAALYLGIAQHMQGRYADALVSLESAMELAEADDLPTGAIAWFQALSHLGLGETDAARDALVSVRDNAGAYAEQAAELLERMEE